MEHVEEREFEIRIHLRASFGPDYEADEDGFVWHEGFERTIKPRLVSAVFDALRTDPRFRVVAAPRGRDPDRGVDIDVEFVSETSTTSKD